MRPASRRGKRCLGSRPACQGGSQAGELDERLHSSRLEQWQDVPVQYDELLRPLDTAQQLNLLERRELGDDRVYLYHAVYRGRTFVVRLGLAPDDKVSLFAVRPK